MTHINGKIVEPTGEIVLPMYSERKCKNCRLFCPTKWSIRTGTCMQSGGTVNREWTCNLDQDGKIRITRQRIVA
jgi:hypothetical protein